MEKEKSKKKYVKRHNQSEVDKVGSPAWIENEQLVMQMIEKEKDYNIFLKENIKSFSKLFRFLYRHPSMHEGFIDGIHIDEISNACHSERATTLKMLEILEYGGFIVYATNDDVYDFSLYEIDLPHRRAWEKIDTCDDPEERERGIYFYVSV